MRFDQLPKTAKEAREWQIPFYYSGQFCKHGHVSPRYAINGLCVGCTKARNKGSKNDPEEVAREYVAKKIAGLEPETRRRFIPDPQRRIEDAKDAIAHYDDRMIMERYDWNGQANQLVSIRQYKVWGVVDQFRNDAEDLIRQGHALEWNKLDGGLYEIVLLLRQHKAPRKAYSDPRG